MMPSSFCVFSGVSGDRIPCIYQAGLQVTMQSRIISLSLPAPEAETTGVCHHTWVVRCWGSKPGLHSCEVSTLLMELLPRPALAQHAKRTHVVGTHRLFLVSPLQDLKYSICTLKTLKYLVNQNTLKVYFWLYMGACDIQKQFYFCKNCSPVCCLRRPLIRN